MSAYKDALQADRAESQLYYSGSVHSKTEQQKAMEHLLEGFTPATVADIACGGGGASYHLGMRYPDAAFTLVEYNDDALNLAREATRGLNATCLNGSIYELPIEGESADLVICWQTLSWIERADEALSELIRICRPGGRILASSLFNFEHDVDVYSGVIDHTRASSASGLAYTYNTYSLPTVSRWVAGRATMQAHRFRIGIDLARQGRGLGTYTVRQPDGTRLQLSAGMLLNWGILELRK